MGFDSSIQLVHGLWNCYTAPCLCLNFSFLIHNFYNIIFSNSPAIEVTPTGSKLTALSPIRAFAALAFTEIFPLQNPHCAQSIFTEETASFEAMKWVQTTSSFYPSNESGCFLSAVGNINLNAFVGNFSGNSSFGVHASRQKPIGGPNILCKYYLFYEFSDHFRPWIIRRSFVNTIYIAQYNKRFHTHHGGNQARQFIIISNINSEMDTVSFSFTMGST